MDHYCEFSGWKPPSLGSRLVSGRECEHFESNRSRDSSQPDNSSRIRSFGGCLKAKSSLVTIGGRGLSDERKQESEPPVAITPCLVPAVPVQDRILDQDHTTRVQETFYLG